MSLVNLRGLGLKRGTGVFKGLMGILLVNMGAPGMWHIGCPHVFEGS